MDLFVKSSYINLQLFAFKNVSFSKFYSEKKSTSNSPNPELPEPRNPANQPSRPLGQSQHQSLGTQKTNGKMVEWMKKVREKWWIFIVHVMSIQESMI